MLGFDSILLDHTLGGAEKHSLEKNKLFITYALIKYCRTCFNRFDATLIGKKDVDSIKVF